MFLQSRAPVPSPAATRERLFTHTSMKRFALSVVVLLLGAMAATPGAAQQRGEMMTPDYVFVIDISRSMKGEGPGSPENIFPRVTQAVERFVTNVDIGSNVVLVPFADGVKGFQRISILSEADRERALRMIRSLEATGNETHVYGAIQEAFRRYAAFRAGEADRATRMVWMLVYTDGRDNGPQGLTMAQIIGAFKLNRQEYDYLYYATLGSRLSDAEILAIEESGVATYVDNPRGEVAPLWIVYPRYSLIDFGNLSEGPRKPVVQSFGRIGSGEFPAEFRMEVTAEFPGIGEAIQAEVEPYRTAPEREVPLRLRLVNGTPANGHYEGTLRFQHGRQQGIVVFPQDVRARFDFGPSPRIRPLAGRLTLGRAAPHSNKPAERTGRATAALSLNTEARTRGGRFVAVLQPDPGNPAPFAPGTVRLNGRAVDVDTVDIRRARSLSVEVDAGQLPPGTYRGKLVLEDGSVKVDGPREIPWELEVASPPMPPWVWAVALAALAALAAVIVRWRRPVLRGRLIIQEPFDRVNTQVSLNGRRELALNENGEVASEGGHVRIVADGVGRNARPRVFKVVDGVYVRKARDGQDLAFQNTVLEHGDELVWEGHRLTYNKN
jgi:hypothetical protein